MSTQAPYDAGMKVRRSVLGDDWVDATLTRKNDFNSEFQEFITRYVWGEIWTREGLDRRTRSCMVLSTMMALGRWEEFRLHVRAAFNNGLGRKDIAEIILQNAVYCGVAAGNHAMAEAEAVFKQFDL